MKHHHEILLGRYVLHNLILRRGCWLARVRDMQTKTTRYFSTRKSNKREALAAARDWVAMTDAQEKGPTHVKFQPAYEEYLSSKTDIRAISAKSYQSDAELLLYPFFGKQDVASISFLDVQRWDKKQAARGLGPATRRRHMKTLRSFFGWAVLARYAEENPTLGFKFPRVERLVRTVLTPEQARVLLAAAVSPGLRLGILLTLHTGLRRHNVRELTWSEVDLVQRRISISGDNMKGRRDHTVPIHRELLEALKERPFLDPAASVLGVRYLSKQFKRALRRAKLPDLRWHDLRHTFAAWVGACCTHDMKMALLGHAPRDVTDAYGAVSFEQKLAAVDDLPRLLTGPEQGSLAQEAT